MNLVAASTGFDEIVRSRSSVRAFRATSVAPSILVEILDLARTAPSIFNTQPWHVHVLAGEAKGRLSEAILHAHSANACPPHAVFPKPVPASCAERRQEFGSRYYAALGINQDDAPARDRQTGRNYVFFDAPIGLIVTIHAALGRHSWLDVGLFLQNLMLAARARGLSTCPQVSFVRYQSVIAKALNLTPQETVVCGMSLGYADDRAAVNQMQMSRLRVDQFTTWSGFD